MKYVKLTAKPDTWYKPLTEVLWENSEYVVRRPTLDEWDHIKKEGGLWCVGTRVVENPNSEGFHYSIGEEREDGEWCHPDEFEVEIVDSENFKGKR